MSMVGTLACEGNPIVSGASEWGAGDAGVRKGVEPAVPGVFGGCCAWEGVFGELTREWNIMRAAGLPIDTVRREGGREGERVARR